MTENARTDSFDLGGRVRTLQIIAGALMMGVILFGAIALASTRGNDPGSPIIALVAAGFTVMEIAVLSFLPGSIVASQRQQMADESWAELSENEQAARLFPLYQTKTIIVYALLEGAAFFNLMAYIVSVQWWLWAVVAALLLAMIAIFPSRAKTERWIHDQRQAMELGT